MSRVHTDLPIDAVGKDIGRRDAKLTCNGQRQFSAIACSLICKVRATISKEEQVITLSVHTVPVANCAPEASSDQVYCFSAGLQAINQLSYPLQIQH